MNNLKTKSLFLFSLLLLAQSTLCLAQPLKINFQIDPSDDPDKPQPVLSYEIKPTKSIEDIMTIKNNSPTETLKLKVYAVDSTQSSDGVAAFKLPSSPQENIGAWLKLNKNELVVAPLQSAIIPYEISIPEKTTPGTYEGALVGELITTDNSIENNSISISTRLTKPLYISVPGRKEISYNLDQFQYQENNGKPGFYIKLSNHGNVFLKGEANLQVEGLLLHKPYEISLNHPTILQGENYEKTLSFENPPLFGHYNATLTFKISEYNVATGQLKELQTITRQISFNIIPYQYIIIFLLIIILIILIEKARRRYIKNQLNDTFSHTVKKGETITTIASLYEVDWHLIVKLNNLKKPYTLRSGKKLLLPFPKSSR